MGAYALAGFAIIHMFEIRPAKIEDKEYIQEVYSFVIGHQTDQDGMSWDRLIRAGGLLVAEDDGRIIGFGGIDVQAVEQLKWLYLLPQYQRVGLGSKILQRLEEIGRDSGLSLLRLHSALPAVEFYRRHGYRAVEPMDLVGHDHEGVEMEKEIMRRDS